jgi:hypothetical protein
MLFYNLSGVVVLCMLHGNKGVSDRDQEPRQPHTSMTTHATFELITIKVMMDVEIST